MLETEGCMHMESVRGSAIDDSIMLFSSLTFLVSCQAYDLGLENQVIAVKADHISEKNRYIVAHNQIHKLPSGIGGLFKSQTLLSKNLLPILLKEPLVPKKKSQDDESIYNFISRRLNSEVTYNIYITIYGNNLNLHTRI